MMRKLTPLTGARDAPADPFAKTFCAVLPSLRGMRDAAQSFCATLPGGQAPDLARAFCATIPAELGRRRGSNRGGRR